MELGTPAPLPKKNPMLRPAMAYPCAAATACPSCVTLITWTSPARSTASQKGTYPLVFVWKIMRTPAARSCSRTAPAAVPSYISNDSPVGSGLEATSCGAEADAPA